MVEAISSFAGEHHFLSNFWEQDVWHCIEVVGKWDLTMQFPSSEHAYQASKTLSLDWIERIWEQPSPGKAKRVGRQAPIREDWEEIKIEVMHSILSQKFRRVQLWDRLLATDDAELIEGNTWGDKFWGVCDGEGENNLGKLLMKIRGGTVILNPRLQMPR